MKLHYIILNCFTKHEKLSLGYLITILQFHLRLNIKQFMKNGILKTSNLKILILDQTLHKFVNKSEILLNEICQIIYFFCFD